MSGYLQFTGCRGAAHAHWHATSADNSHRRAMVSENAEAFRHRVAGKHFGKGCLSN